MTEVESLLRVRHNLRLDQPNDFDLVTQDLALKIWQQISQAIFLALVVISSIALMVGGIGVMAIMMISVTERTREIGVRKALGARRREILWQFLIEAGFLTSVGGLLGILFGSAIGLGIHWATGFPVSLPWWSFAIGFGFSAGIGIFFGLYPAIKASRLDPIEAPARVPASSAASRSHADDVSSCRREAPLVARRGQRGSDPAPRRFSMGSCNELEYDLLFARDLTFLPEKEHTQLTGQLVEVRRMLTGLIESVK
jgi:hypothetical protein